MQLRSKRACGQNNFYSRFNFNNLNAQKQFSEIHAIDNIELSFVVWRKPKNDTDRLNVGAIFLKQSIPKGMRVLLKIECNDIPKFNSNIGATVTANDNAIGTSLYTLEQASDWKILGRRAI